MRLLDWAIVAAYLIYIVYDGLRLTKRSNEVEGYFLANRSLPWWAVGLSVMATQMSAITLVGTTGQAYADGMRFIQFYFGLPVAMVILCVTVVPFFYRAKVYTAYEYLERRFDSKTRALASACFLFQRGLSCGVIIAAPSVVLSIALGWSDWQTVLAIGLIMTFYTMFGGVQAVTWTDVKQMVVVFIGLLIVLFIIVSKFPAGVSVGAALNLAGSVGRVKTVDTSFDPRQTYTLWSGLIGGLFLMLSYFGCDQSQVQRFLTARSVSEGRVSLLMSAFIKIPMQFLILFIGVMVFVFYQFTQPPMIFKADDRASIEQSAEYQRLNAEFQSAFASRRRAAIDFANAGGQGDISAAAKQSFVAADKEIGAVRKRAGDLIQSATGKTFNDTNYVFPTFITTYAPIGVVGLMVAAIFAAAMTASSGELNALATTTVMDVYRRHIRQGASDAHYLKVAKVATGFWGLFACVVALFAARQGSLIEVVNKFGSYFYGSMLGVFMLAIGTKRATGGGAFWGMLCGLASVAVVSNLTKISFLWYNVIGCAVVIAVGMSLSLIVNKTATHN
ncbi:MAG: sodium:solute symporter [Chloracidobacterium sp.]|nr:sodium:solute symporter [Chloracidobacterium sp.]